MGWSGEPVRSKIDPVVPGAEKAKFEDGDWGVWWSDDIESGLEVHNRETGEVIEIPGHVLMRLVFAQVQSNMVTRIEGMSPDDLLAEAGVLLPGQKSGL